MRNGVAAVSSLAVAAAWLAPGASGARVCGATAASETFQYRFIEVRYDGPDPNKSSHLSTIAASLGTSSTPLYECVAQWPETWAGWFEGGPNIVWSDCIWTGAGSGADKTVSFAVDWKKKTVYLSHTFACSDKRGSDGLATGSLSLDFNCTTADGSSFCVPKSTSTGDRPTLRVSTTLRTTVGGGAATTPTSCQAGAKTYQSWRLDKWLRQYQMAPGSSAPDSTRPLPADTGPSFALTNLADGSAFSCAPSGQKNGTFEGTCKSAAAATGTTAAFTFDPVLNMVQVSQHWDCGDS
ncbi:hypothetical protein B0T26DRAFT_787726 [Lasiosphaeria miniovina]|uniref:Secreted protein n=1 Tax=Lasiosphaeria miniovina TaxID=1954250 RepID=A0AA40A6M1_9PEZI|nr:uncharacterized protein B0T26DRAFT_787726 [Lasiosphaeria miniovina]KAK0710276.1 hypothetical protein B0T26DRAFT_787726 [Lasiosphaeria miniovina]